MAEAHESQSGSADVEAPGSAAAHEADATSRLGDEPKKAPEDRLPGAGTADGETLRAALRAFEVGDFVRVREKARRLQDASDPAVRQAAAELLERISIDPLQIVVFLACVAVFATIVQVWVL